MCRPARLRRGTGTPAGCGTTKVSLWPTAAWVIPAAAVSTLTRVRRGTAKSGSAGPRPRCRLVDWGCQYHFAHFCFPCVPARIGRCWHRRRVPPPRRAGGLRPRVLTRRPLPRRPALQAMPGHSLMRRRNQMNFESNFDELCGHPPHTTWTTSSNRMARIASDCGAVRSPSASNGPDHLGLCAPSGTRCMPCTPCTPCAGGSL